MVRIMKRLGCLVGKHAPVRRAVQYDGNIKVGPCRYCGAELEKRADGRWVARKGGARDEIAEKRAP